MKAGFMTLGYVGHLWVVFATSLRSSTERHGDFSESVVFSLCFLGVLFGFGCWVVCVVVCCLVFCVCLWHLDHCLTFSLLRGNRQSKQDVLMTVWASSAHGAAQKKKGPSAHSRPPKKLKLAASGTRFTDWIGGSCSAGVVSCHWVWKLQVCVGSKTGRLFCPAVRVSELTYQTIIAVRYPELDADTPTHVAFGNYLAARQARVGGFMPVFWRSPHNVIHATVDIGQMADWISKQLELEAGENGCLAVLHNRNDMSGALNSSDWVVNSKGRVISIGGTSCAGMTAQHVLLAQTKIGFLSGGRGYSFQDLSTEDKQSQREEAFARATVALTRAQRFCFIMCPLDMKGIIGAATVVGCLQHGAGVCDERSTGSSLLVELKASSLASSREDENFLAALRHSATVKTGEFL